MPPATNSAGALQNLQTAQSSQQTPDQIVQGANTQLGVPQAQAGVSGLRQAIASTTNLLNNVAPSVYGRTGNSLVTDAQAGKIISNEQAPISTNLGKENTDLTNQSADLSSLLSQAGNLESLKTSAQQNNISNLENIYKDMSASEQAQAAQALAAQQRQDQIDQFNQSLGKASAGGGSASSNAADAKAAAEATQQNAVQKITANLAPLTGNKGGTARGDSYVSPANYAAAAASWAKQGYKMSDFTAYFGYFRNPGIMKQYVS